MHIKSILIVGWDYERVAQRLFYVLCTYCSTYIKIVPYKKIIEKGPVGLFPLYINLVNERGLKVGGGDPQFMTLCMKAFVIEGI